MAYVLMIHKKQHIWLIIKHLQNISQDFIKHSVVQVAPPLKKGSYGSWILFYE